VRIVVYSSQEVRIVVYASQEVCIVIHEVAGFALSFKYIKAGLFTSNILIP
jgi:hypothetical protein